MLFWEYLLQQLVSGGSHDQDQFLKKLFFHVDCYLDHECVAKDICHLWLHHLTTCSVHKGAIRYCSFLQGVKVMTKEMMSDEQCQAVRAPQIQLWLQKVCRYQGDGRGHVHEDLKLGCGAQRRVCCP